MSNTKLKLLAAVALAGGSALAGAANAQLQAYGGGASLPAPYFRQAADCYGDKTALINRGTPPTTQLVPDFNYTGSAAFNCATTTVRPGQIINYISTGSGVGIAGIYSHDPAKYGDVDPNTAGDQLYPSVHYGLSETALGVNEVNTYNNGGVLQGVTVVAQGVTPAAGQYANPRERFGPLIQVPALIAPVTIGFDPVYKKVRNGDGSVTEYKLRLRFPRPDGSGGLRLDRAAYCGIFNGTITNWNDPALKILNGNQSLRDVADPTADASWSVPLQIAGRNDSSGTTSLWTRHLAAVCGAAPANGYADSTSTLPAGLQGPVYNKANANTPVAGETLGKYTRADGNDGVAKYVDFTQAPGLTAGDQVIQGRVAYLGPDYVLPAVNNTGANTFGLQTADLKNASGNFRQPTASNAAAAFGASLLPPDSLSDGHYDAASTDPRDRAKPQDWVEPASKTSVLADPTTSTAYPIVGTSNLLTYTCFRSSSNRTPLQTYMNYYFGNIAVNDTTLGLLAKSGFAPMPGSWRIAIRETFVQNGSGLDLTIFTRGQSASCPSTIFGA